MEDYNISFLQQEVRSKDELIKSLMGTQTIVLETISEQNQFKKPDKNLSNVLQHQHKNYIKNVHHTSQYEQYFNLEQKPQMPSNSATKQHSKSNRQSEKARNKTQEVKAKKIYIENQNDNVSNKDIYKFFGLKTTEYLRQTRSVDLKLSEKAEKNEVLGLSPFQNF